MNNALKTSEAAGNVLTAVSEGEPTPIKATRLMVLIDSYRRTWELTDIEERCGIWKQIRSAIPTPTQRFNQCLIIQDFVGTLSVLEWYIRLVSVSLSTIGRHLCLLLESFYYQQQLLQLQPLF